MNHKDAKALGLKTYNTGKPCKHHPDKAGGCERYTARRNCVEYQKEYQKEYEKKRSQTPKRKEYEKKRSQTPKRKEYEKKRSQTPKRKEYEKEYQKEYRKTPKRKEYEKKRRQTPKRKEYEKKRSQTPKRKEYEKEYKKERAKTNIQFRLAKNLRTRLYNAIKNGQKAGSAVRDLGCSMDQCKQHLESQFEPGMSWDNWSNKEGCWSIDHIRPLSRFNLKDRQQCLEACHYTNLRPMWHIENIKKGAKY